METATGPAHAIGRDDQRDAGLGAGRHIHRVIADAEAGDHREPAIGVDALPPEACAQQDESVEIRQLLGLDGIGALEEDHLHAGRLAQRRQVEIRIDRRAVGLAEIAGKGDAEGPAHFRAAFLAAAGFRRELPLRSAVMASARALCRTQTSPE